MKKVTENEKTADKKKIKILEALGEPIGIGGQESFVFGFLEKMKRDGITIDCLTAYNCYNERYRSMIEDKGGKVFCLNLPFRPGKRRDDIVAPLTSFLKENVYDVIHVHSGSISALAIMAFVAKKSGVKKVIVHSHATGFSNSVKHKVLRFLASLFMSRNVDIYCACSREAAEWKYIKKHADKALIIKDGIDEQRFRYDPEKRKEVRRRLGFSENNYVLGHIGRFSREKNHSFLIEVFEALCQKDKVLMIT